jgi:hypothetical protein
MSKRFKLDPEAAAVILRTNENNVDAATKRLLQKVVDKRPLSEEEIGELEGIQANHQLLEEAKTKDIEPAGDQTAAVATRFNFKKAERDLAVQSRRRLVLELRTQHPPVTIREIARRLEISTDTVQKDIDAIKETHAKVLDGALTLHILGQTCEQYDILYGKAMALAEKFTSPMAKAAFIRTAISALDSKSRLMGETGIIHKVPERHEHLVAAVNGGATVRDRVSKLIIAQEQRTSPILEIKQPAAIPVEVTEAEMPQEDAPE